MDDKYKSFRKRITRMCKPSVVDLCHKAGLTEEETRLIIMSYNEKRGEDYVASQFNMSRSACHEKKRLLVDRIMDFEEFISIQMKANGRGGAYVQ